MNIQKRKTQVPVKFEVEYEIHERKKFQAAGHFVPAVRERDAQGNQTSQPRRWKGAHVHALTVFAPTGEQLLRALSDSRADAELQLGDLIRASFWGSMKALDIAGLNVEQARKSKDERDRLAAWMLQHAPAEFARVLGIAEAAVEEYRAKESALQVDPSPISELLKRGA